MYNNLFSRSVDKKMQSVGTIVILDTDVGCLALMYPPKCSIKTFKNRLSPLSSIL